MSEDTKICPVCAETIKAAALKCRFCNTDLAAYKTVHEATTEKLLFSGNPAVIHTAWQWPIVIVTLGIAYIFYWFVAMNAHYEITTQRVRIERGLLSKTKDSIELFRIDHFDLNKPLGMRLLGFCSLNLRSTDTSFPSVTLYGIPELEPLADRLREYGLLERTRRRVTTLVNA
jgi:membrane protein YdbS with pleckstrin-like domain